MWLYWPPSRYTWVSRLPPLFSPCSCFKPVSYQTSLKLCILCLIQVSDHAKFQFTSHLYCHYWITSSYIKHNSPLWQKLPYFPDYRSLWNISRMRIKCAYFPEKSTQKSHRCISCTDQQTCIGLNNAVLPSCRVWVNTMLALCRRRVPGEISVRSQQLMLQLTSHHWLTVCQFTAAARQASHNDAHDCHCKRRQSRFTNTAAALPSLHGERAQLPYTGNSITAIENNGPVSNLVCTQHRLTRQIPVTWSAACITHGSVPSTQPTGIQLTVSSPVVSNRG